MRVQDYSHYVLTDFLEDDFFIRWVIAPDTQANIFWEAFLTHYPEKREVVSQASSIIGTYRRLETFTNESRKDAVWDKIRSEIQQNHVPVQKPATVIPMYMKAAAAIVLLAVFGGVLWLMSDHRNLVTTAHNEITKVILPDHSVVMLNGNSTLRYERNWQADEPREVWIDGEAFFKVKHINRDTLHIDPAHRFIVHSNNLDIEVLGTSFNVQQREEKTNVTLITGKVKVQFTGTPSVHAPDVILLPGDFVEYGSQKLLARKKLSNPQRATSWMKQELLFTNPALKDIVKTLQEDYGYTVEVKDPALLDLRIEGEISVSSVEELLSTVSATLGIRIEEDHKHITMSRR